MKPKPAYINEIEALINANPVKKYSQTGEEGIILAICKFLGIQKGIFIDFGAGTGRELSNVALLYEMRWVGIGYEGGNPVNPAEFVKTGKWITKENVQFLYSDKAWRGIDFLSIDLDGNDFWILKSIIEKCQSKPKIICAEINGSLPEFPAVAIEYNPDHRFQNNNYYGMSYGAFCKLMQENNYQVVHNQQGLNAFAVRGDLLPEVSDWVPMFTQKNDWPYGPGKWVQV